MDSEKGKQPDQEGDVASSQEPPQYFDSEPSSQPPSYGKIASKHTPKRSAEPASAASIAAVLGPPPEKGPKRTWADRWKDLKTGNNYGGKDASGADRLESSSKWNSQGVVLGDPRKGKK